MSPKCVYHRVLSGGAVAQKRRRSAFVPRIIFGTIFVGVVPAVATCGGDDTSGGGQSGTTMKGVAAGGVRPARRGLPRLLRGGARGGRAARPAGVLGGSAADASRGRG